MFLLTCFVVFRQCNIIFRKAIKSKEHQSCISLRRMGKEKGSVHSFFSRIDHLGNERRWVESLKLVLFVTNQYYYPSKRAGIWKSYVFICHTTTLVC